MLKVLVVSGYFEPGYKAGGPIKSIKNLLKQTADEIEFKLITSDRDLGDSFPYETVMSGAWNKVGNVQVFYVASGLKGYKQIFQILRKRGYDLVYLNSFFSVRFSLFPLLLARVFRKKILLSPRGEFSKGALSIKSFKKNIFINTFKLLKLQNKLVLQASSSYEADNIRGVLGVDVDVQIAENVGAQQFALQVIKRDLAVLKLVFLSRISPMKNLLFALKVLQKVKYPVEYHIYGPIEDVHYWQQCEEFFLNLPPNVKVEHKGALNPDDVINVLTRYDAFFMPTRGENYGHAITEALCAGLPVVIADTTPWRNLEDSGIGWDLALSEPDSFSRVLNNLANMSPDEHFGMRKRVLTWAKNKFSQRNALEANMALFKYTYEKK